MNLLLVIVLIVAGFLLLEAGFEFIAFLLFLLAVINSLSPSPGERKAPAPQKQRPVIVTTTGGELPEVIRVGVKPGWAGTDAMEDFMATAGQILNIPCAIIARFAGMRKMPKWKEG